jgi:hypothetical protein
LPRANGLHSAAVGEGLEALAAVIRTDAARADSAEGQVRVGELQQCRVDAHTAARRVVDELVVVAVILAEGVERERVFAVADKSGGCVLVVHGYHREDRAEDLLSHDAMVEVDIDEDGGRQVLIGLVEVSAHHRPTAIQEPP